MPNQYDIIKQVRIHKSKRLNLENNKNSSNKIYLVIGILVWLFWFIGFPFMSWMYFNFYLDEKATITINCNRNICKINESKFFNINKQYSFEANEFIKAQSTLTVNLRWTAEEKEPHGLIIYLKKYKYIRLFDFHNRKYIEDKATYLNDYIFNKQNGNLKLVLTSGNFPITMNLFFSVFCIFVWGLPLIKILSQVYRKNFG
ncbi:MAG: hypothetical protein A2104_04725 [Candidatus Melainabacteria bacterium GWF2_32_7]|nr:MAG: hypothetical protein A2104_04725 [Candidatus Melainabacteria bacterium GWF2_32_7]